MKLLWLITLLICLFSLNTLAQEISKQGIENIVKAAEQGDVDAQAELGAMFLYGKGVTKNRTEALKWYHKAAEQGHSKAQNKLGDSYQYGRNGVIKDRSIAIKWYQKSAEQGNASGAYELGSMFYYGNINTQNHTEAAKWYRKSALLGSKEGQYKLGRMYLHGEIVDRDINEAEKWFLKAAKQGSLPAKARLYEMTSEGKKEIASKKISQTIDTLLSLLLFFPVWWLIAGYLFNCSLKRQIIIAIIIFASGIVGLFITFACGGGAGGSSEMNSSTWGCFLPYMVIQNITLALIIFSGKQNKKV